MRKFVRTLAKRNWPTSPSPSRQSTPGIASASPVASCPDRINPSATASLPQLCDGPVIRTSDNSRRTVHQVHQVHEVFFLLFLRVPWCSWWTKISRPSWITSPHNTQSPANSSHTTSPAQSPDDSRFSPQSPGTIPIPANHRSWPPPAPPSPSPTTPPAYPDPQLTKPAPFHTAPCATSS